LKDFLVVVVDSVETIAKYPCCGFETATLIGSQETKEEVVEKRVQENVEEHHYKYQQQYGEEDKFIQDNNHHAQCV
jgi:hypothetical protein